LSQADFLQQVGKIVPWDEESRAILRKMRHFPARRGFSPSIQTVNLY
jgi:hypothetical protein